MESKSNKDVPVPENDSLFHLDMFEMLRKAKEQKKNSRILIKKSESKDGRLIDPRFGFANSLCSLAVSDIKPDSTSNPAHKHSEAYLYFIKGRGYSIVGGQGKKVKGVWTIEGGKRYDWEEGDAIYIPPDTWHQHWNVDKEKTASFLRVVPGPFVVNLIAFLASINASLDGMLQGQFFE